MRKSQSSRKPIKVIVTGATGMVGEGVLHECLLHPDVEQVLVINRRPCGISHPKLKEILHDDFSDLTLLEPHLSGYDACYFCLGVSSAGMSEAAYTKVTYNLTLHAAELLARLNPNSIFCYVSGSGTDSTERGRMMWARVKGRTENRLLTLPFKRVYLFRPGYMHPTKGLKRTHRYYRYLSWLYPAVRLIIPQYLITLRELGIAMIRSTTQGYPSNILEPRDIQKLAQG